MPVFPLVGSDDHPRTQPTLLDRVVDHGRPDSVLHRVERIVAFVLHRDPGGQARSHPGEPNQGRVPDGLSDVLVDLSVCHWCLACCPTWIAGSALARIIRLDPPGTHLRAGPTHPQRPGLPPPHKKTQCFGETTGPLLPPRPTYTPALRVGGCCGQKVPLKHWVLLCGSGSACSQRGGVADSEISRVTRSRSAARGS